MGNSIVSQGHIGKWHYMCLNLLFIALGGILIYAAFSLKRIPVETGSLQAFDKSFLQALSVDIIRVFAILGVFCSLLFINMLLSVGRFDVTGTIISLLPIVGVSVLIYFKDSLSLGSVLFASTSLLFLKINE